MNRRFTSSCFVTAAILALSSCASDQPKPIDALAAARTAITEAEAAGAMQSSPTELLSAREKLGRAQAAMRDEKYLAARQLAESAEADALLADRTTRAKKAELAAQEIARSNELLRRETERNVTR